MLTVLLNLKREQEFVEEVEEFLEEYDTIPDEDRALVNEAIRANLDLQHIETLLKTFPRACESGGCVDHINHPIHVACAIYPRAVPTILKFAPESAGQYDENGKPPIELFLTNSENQEPKDITTEEIIGIAYQLYRMNPTVAKECIKKIEKLKEETSQD
jgi:hypothetical protein